MSILSMIGRAVARGLLILVPVYIAVLLLLKAMKTVSTLVSPVAKLLPDSVPAESLLSLILVLLVCFVIGAAVSTSMGDSLRQRLETKLFDRIPGYSLVRGLTEQAMGKSEDSLWKPAIVEFDDATVPAFIIEEHDDGRYTVLVPSIPTPLAGGVYIMERRRVHPLDVPFTDALKTVSRWGSGSKGLVAAMEREARSAERLAPPVSPLPPVR